MNSDRSAAPAHPGRRDDRLIGIALGLGLTMAAMPASALAWGRPAAPNQDSSFGFTGLSGAGEALSRGELPIDLLVAGSLAAVAVGFTLALLVGALRRRRPAPRPEPTPAESSEDFVDARTTLPWPTEDADAFRTAPRPDDASPAIDEQAPAPFAAYRPSAPRDAVWAERWAAHEATSEIARQRSGWPSEAPADVTLETASTSEPIPATPQLEENEVVARVAPVSVDTGTSARMDPTWAHPDSPLPPAAISAIESTLATRTETPFARSTLGTLDAPLVVEIRDERNATAARRAGPNLALVAVIGTVAVGVAFAAGAAVGAALGAGVAIGATVALLGGDRR